MANRRTVGGVILNESTVATNVSSPLRRRSMAIVPAPDLPSNVASNDDDHERIARRRQSRAFDSPVNTENSRRVSLGLVSGLTGNELTEHYHQCLRLCAENKLTAKNVFGLAVIDYMGVLNKRDGSTNSMQTAQATLDISTKIYGLRVDCVHADVLKMAGNPVKQVTRNGDEEAQDMGNTTTTTTTEEAEKKKRKRKAQKIFASAESLSAEADVRNLRSTAKNSDSQTSDMLLQATYPVLVQSGHSLHLYEDLLLEIPEVNEAGVEKEYGEVEIDIPEDFTELDICPMLKDFKILGWSEADVQDSSPSPSTSGNGNFRFDLDASLVEDNADNEYIFDADDESQENVDRCVRRPEQIEHLVDFQKTIIENPTKEKTLEYSYLREGNSNLHWAGPGHWKPFGFQKSIGQSTEVGVCGQEKRRKKQHPDLGFPTDLEEDIEHKLSRKGKNLQSRTVKYDWPEEKLILPDDVHFEDDKYTKFYYDTVRKSALFSELRNRGETRDGDGDGGDHETTILEDVEYNYNNDNDTQDYCSQNQVAEDLENGNNAEEFEQGDENADPEAVIGTQAFTGDNLVAAPKSTQQIQINYATRAKKVNMKQLKDGMWKCLKFQDNHEDVEGEERESGIQQDEEERQFSQTYKKLELVLGSEKSQALSIGLAFSSLLHLANEKNLKLETVNDLTDLKISLNHGRQGIN